jgi:hypothetical protein
MRTQKLHPSRTSDYQKDLPVIIIQVPVTTEVLNHNEDIHPNGKAENQNLKERGEAAQTVWYAEKLKRMAAELWKHRCIFFKSDQNLTDKEKEIMQKVLNLRFASCAVFSIKSGQSSTAQRLNWKRNIKLMELKQYAQFHEDDGYSKSITFLEENFKNMTTFLRVEGVKRNSLSETGMRVLRRLEQNHDGFRSKQGRQNAIRIYQAVTYLGWTIHNPPKLTDSSG